MRTIRKKRRRESKTNYKLRLGLLKSGLLRIVIRKTNKYILLQVVESNEAQDKALISVSSKDLLKNGWDEKYSGSLKNVAAAYLAGLLLAKKILESDIKDKEFILDAGLARSIAGGRIYSATKGLVEGGVKLRISKEVFPTQERLDGKHLKPEVQELIKQVKEKLK